MAGGINTYGYANQNPLSFSDSLGLNPFDGGSTTSSDVPGPPTDVFIPGTPANNAFVQSVNQIANAVKNLCEKKDCPPCKTVSGKIVPVGTVAYRPLDIIPDDVKQHGVYGYHHNLFVAKQYPYPKCDCFWAKQPQVAKPNEIQPSWIPIEPFVN